MINKLVLLFFLLFGISLNAVAALNVSPCDKSTLLITNDLRKNNISDITIISHHSEKGHLDLSDNTIIHPFQTIKAELNSSTGSHGGVKGTILLRDKDHDDIKLYYKLIKKNTDQCIVDHAYVESNASKIANISVHTIDGYPTTIEYKIINKN